ncbi:MAG: heavy metal-binding domain-containing protein [Bacteroidota bacterium]
MHPDVVRNEPGNCPKCGMKLVPKRGNKMAGHTLLMLMLCLLPVIIVLLLPVIGIHINTTLILVVALAACCILPMLFMRRTQRNVDSK